ncbi:MAG TPA: hypothetical protein VNO30_19180 [Kofleriaceae bacterium]|nr:hypothetical protein [Kofleriaceae bacterium]
MESVIGYRRIRAVAAAVLVALPLVLVLAPPVARAEVARTGGEPWYGQASAAARQRAQALFAQAFDKHQQLLRGEAMELYEQALAQWDNPDIRWNLALVLADLGQYLRAYQGVSVALSADGSTLAVGAYGEASVATGIGCNQADNSVLYAGAVYAYTRSGTTWSQQAYVKASNTGITDYFGASVALSGDGSILAVGASGEASAATGIFGDQANNSASAAGAVYVFSDPVWLP